MKHMIVFYRFLQTGYWIYHFERPNKYVLNRAGVPATAHTPAIFLLLR